MNTNIPRANVSEEIDATGDMRLERFIPALITWAAHRLAANNGAVYRKAFDVTLMEWRVMLHLVSDPGSSAAQLAQTIGYDKASISRTVASLSGRGMLEERVNQSDARSSHLHLTEPGIARYRDILPVALEQERELLADLSSEEAEVLVDLMHRVVGALRRQGKSPSTKRSATKRAARARG